MYLGIDFGTTGARACVIAPGGQIEDMVRVEFGTLTPDEAAATWRMRDPATRVIVVDALDIREETPVLQLGARRIYLATSSGVCLSITQQPEHATALVLAED